MLKILIPVDGSTNSLRAVKLAAGNMTLYKEQPEIHLLNVQRPLPGNIWGIRNKAADLHREEGIKALAGARKALDRARVKYEHHISVGEVESVIARFVKAKKIDQVLMGTRGLGPVGNLFLGSVAIKVLQLVDVPVLLVR